MYVFEEPNDGIDLLLFYIIINKMKQQITENIENLLFWKINCPGISSDLKKCNYFIGMPADFDFGKLYQTGHSFFGLFCHVVHLGTI